MERPASGQAEVRRLEHRLGDWARARLPWPIHELALFVLKQGWACLFGGLLLGALLLTDAVWQPGWPVARYDALLLLALGPDARWLLMAGTLLLFGGTRVWFRVDRDWRWMPLPLAALLASGALYVAEVVGTATGTWLYAGQMPGDWASPAKMGSWYLLLWVAFVTVTLVSRGALSREPWAPPQAARSAPPTPAA